MLNTIVAFKDSIIKKFGPVLGWAILIVGTLAALSIIGFLFKVFFRIAIGLVVAGLVLFGVYKAYEALSAKNGINTGN